MSGKNMSTLVVKIMVNGKQTLAVRISEGKYADIYGELRRCQPENVSRARNVPEDVRKCFENICTQYRKRDYNSFKIS